MRQLLVAFQELAHLLLQVQYFVWVWFLIILEQFHRGLQLIVLFFDFFNLLISSWNKLHRLIILDLEIWNVVFIALDFLLVPLHLHLQFVNLFFEFGVLFAVLSVFNPEHWIDILKVLDLIVFILKQTLFFECILNDLIQVDFLLAAIGTERIICDPSITLTAKFENLRLFTYVDTFDLQASKILT